MTSIINRHPKSVFGEIQLRLEFLASAKEFDRIDLGTCESNSFGIRYSVVLMKTSHGESIYGSGFGPTLPEAYGEAHARLTKNLQQHNDSQDRAAAEFGSILPRVRKTRAS